MICSNCGGPRKVGRRRCATCHSYLMRNKQERPERLYRYGITAVSKPAWCAVCGKGKIRRRCLCAACYDYARRHKGRRRPRWFWSDEYRCKNCKIPLASFEKRADGRRRQTRGMCLPCYNYTLRSGQPRPRHLWGAGPHGWCECGFPAVALVGKDIPVCERHREE